MISPRARADCHVHVVGDPARYPQVATRPYLAGPAPLAELRRQGAAHGISRFVIAQASFYGSDNTLLLESLDALSGNGRGVAVVDPATAQEEQLSMLHRRGIRGLRINLYSRQVGQDFAPLDRVFAAQADLARAMGWHVEVIAALGMVLENVALIANAGVWVVLDHYGLVGRLTPESAAGRQFLDLLRRGHVWVKLSAPYRLSGNPLDTRPDPAWLSAILEAAPDRCVWGSDWPHTPPPEQHLGADSPAPYRAIDYGTLVDHFLSALPAADLAERIFIRNPARLYDFPDPG
ncbi:MAG TPA: amidohydrolase family protein [Stellaceae bacterium]|nr:amidohydrolase family protein [Stellaceae bacterium]